MDLQDITDVPTLIEGEDVNEVLEPRMRAGDGSSYRYRERFLIVFALI
jgi:hypothetical protein